MVLFLTASADSQTNNNKSMTLRIETLARRASETVFVHVHIPKAGGTALAIAISSECQCNLDSRTPHCSNCKQVTGRAGNSVPYTISRLTGWKFGVHPPYAVMKHHLAPRMKNITPVFLIMLRNPFERFVSEIRVWGGDAGQAVDWNIVNYRNGKAIYFPGANASFLNPHHKKNDEHFGKRLQLYASLPNDLYYQNRQVKMIGGERNHFASIHSNSRLGSGYSPPEGTNMNIIYEKAVSVLREDVHVLMGLEERFAEMLCTLEALYGSIYKFKWDSETSTHGHSKTNMTLVAASTKKDTYPAAYAEWKKHNELEEKLYGVAEGIFEEQFQTTLQLLSRKMRSGQIKKNRIPHCIPFIESNH